MPLNSNVIPYEIAFVILVVLVALLSGPKLARVSRILIVLYVPFAVILSIYYLAFKKSTWQESTIQHPLSDADRYSRATKRSSAVYVVINVIMLVGAKIFGISYSNITYNYISLFVTTMITYMYDRCVATDDGLSHLKASPGRTILDSYLSFCSPSFMRYLIVLACDISLTILISYFIGSLIPPQCWVAVILFKKSIVPVLVFSIVTGPLRFAWAYPTVSESGRIPYLLAYTIAFVILGVLTFASGTVSASSAAGILILMAIIAMLLQLGGMSNAPHEPDVYDDANVMPLWAMSIFSTLIVISVLVIAYRIFIDFLQPYVLINSGDKSKIKASLPTTPANKCLERRRYCRSV